MENKTRKIITLSGLALLIISWLSGLTLVVFFFGYNFSPLTPWGGTRWSVFLSGYPLNAITTGLEYHDDGMGDHYYILSNPPYEDATGSILDQWNIKKIGIFYWAAFGQA